MPASKFIAEERKTRCKAGHFVGWFHDNCWRANVHLIWPADGKVLTAYIKRTFGLDFPPNEKPAAGRCTELVTHNGRNGAHIISLAEWDNTPRSHAILAHECFHAADQVLEQRGLKLSDATSETYAYLLESFIFRSLNILMPRPTPRRKPGPSSKRPPAQKFRRAYSARA